ncbi:hypothetical protein C5S29_02735, partial [ANME-1 cluster archaeon GoMg3.2]|nr:hypothetical protein [ANME-1 cluster archaeon GoMg3.2]
GRKKMPAELTKEDIFMIRILNNPEFQPKNFGVG